MPLTGFERATIATLTVAALAVPASLLAIQETEQVDRTVAFPASGTLELHNFSGLVQITGTTGKDLVVRAVRRGDRDQLEHIKLDIQTIGSVVKVEANKRDAAWERRTDRNVVETTFDIQVPASARLDINVFSSDLEIKGVAGPQRLETFSGAVVVDAAAAGAAPDLDVKTFSGGIRARLADAAKGEVHFSSFSGSFDTEVPLTMRSTGSRRVRADLPAGSGGRTLSFETFSGSVRITK